MAGDGNYEGFKLESLQGVIKDAESIVIEKLTAIKTKAKEEVNIGDMFDMQWMMNKLSQLSEMTLAVIGAAHQAVSAMNRNIK